MPLYEYILRWPDGREEVRIGDHARQVGDTLTVANREWTVVRLERELPDLRATARFLCELTREQRDCTLAARRKDAELRCRAQALHDRIDRESLSARHGADAAT
jgi:hypothetical protein